MSCVQINRETVVYNFYHSNSFTPEPISVLNLNNIKEVIKIRVTHKP